jgi:hypothetical protein
MALLTRATDESAQPTRERAAVVAAKSRRETAREAYERAQARVGEIGLILGDGRTPREGPTYDERVILRARAERSRAQETLDLARVEMLDADADYVQLIEGLTAEVVAERRERRRPLMRAAFEAAQALVETVTELEEFDTETARLSGGRRPECPFPSFLPSNPTVENLVDFRRRIFAGDL